MSYTKKEVQAFAKQCDSVERDTKTEIHRQGELAAKLSLRKGWDEDDVTGNGEARKFFIEVLTVRGVKPTPKAIERYSLAAQPLVRKRFDLLMKKSLPLFDKYPSCKKNNVQEAMLREAKTGVSTADVVAKGEAAAKKSHETEQARNKGGTQSFKSRAELVKNINTSIKRKLVTYYGKEKAEALYTEVCIRAGDLPDTKPFKKPAAKKPAAKKK